MSHESDAAAVLQQVIPVGDDHPVADELAASVARHVANRPAPPAPAPARSPAFTFPTSSTNNPTSVAAGDVLVFQAPADLPASVVADIRAELVDALGDVTVIVTPCTVTGHYRLEEGPTHD